MSKQLKPSLAERVCEVGIEALALLQSMRKLKVFLDTHYASLVEVYGEEPIVLSQNTIGSFLSSSATHLEEVMRFYMKVHASVDCQACKIEKDTQGVMSLEDHLCGLQFLRSE